MNTEENNHLVPHFFEGFGILAVVGGGFLAAFSAHAPTQPLVWASAYLVLIVGVAQVALALTLHRLAPGSKRLPLTMALTAFNLGNLGVILGTLLGRVLWIVNTGGLFLVVSLALCIFLVRSAKRSWLLGIFYLVTVVLLVSIPIGLWLSTRPH